MIWLVVGAIALIAFAVCALVLKVPRAGWSALGAALLLGLAGYAMQASPGLPGSPAAPFAATPSTQGALVAARDLLDESDIPTTNRWIVIADAMARNGQHADAAQVLLGALDEDRDDAQAWLALGNALVAHAEGLLTPPAIYAYGQAASAAPKSPGPPYFLGLAMAQSGRFAEARTTWSALLERSPADAPWRPMLSEQLARLDLLIEAQSRAAAGR